MENGAHYVIHNISTPYEYVSWSYDEDDVVFGLRRERFTRAQAAHALASIPRDMRHHFRIERVPAKIEGQP